MSRRIFTEEQIETLLRNKHVIKCSAKTISYAKEFKLLAIELHNQGLTAAEIFWDEGFDLNVVGRNLPYKCMNRWLKTYEAEGPDGLREESRGRGGGRPRTKDLTDSDRIKRLEIEIAYLKAENDFLAKLRASKKS